jgi:hypothetical protein
VHGNRKKAQKTLFWGSSKAELLGDECMYVLLQTKIPTGEATTLA